MQPVGIGGEAANRQRIALGLASAFVTIGDTGATRRQGRAATRGIFPLLFRSLPVNARCSTALLGGGVGAGRSVDSRHPNNPAPES